MTAASTLCIAAKPDASRLITDWQHFHCPPHRTIDGVVDAFYTTYAELKRGGVVAFVRRKGNTYFLVHNVRRQGKVQQLHLARLGERPRITDDVVRKVSRNHPFLDLDWSSLREQVNSRIELFDIRSPYVQNLMHSLRNLHMDLADLSPPMLLLTDRANSSRELVTQLRLLRSTLDIKLDQFERTEIRNPESGREFR
ncbi:MAG TPA: hypothetical protein VN861_18620 [Candidatus Acidoferrales bacterium]|nr:hypothetical protein [Candidatus Acidoferrales bacterium]